MYKHLLIPTDGSDTAHKAVKEGLKFAKWAGARVTAFTAMPAYPIPSSGEFIARTAISMQEHESRARAQATEILDRIAVEAREAGVELDTEVALSDTPWQAIIRAAEKHGCDLIFIASHGRRGVSALLHGSETREVLTHSTIPTLVYR